MGSEPWYQATYQHNVLGVALKLRVPHDVFSTMRIDDGTLLLLEHLPPIEPKSVLDMGCGYGALGLPVAARFPQAQVEMVDRDLLPVAWAGSNARENGITNAIVHGSLGYRDLTPRQRFDWILCNVPARIGRPFIEYLFAAGRERLTPQGELRVVVIRDLAPLIDELRVRHGWPITEVTRGPRHLVFALAADPLFSSREQCANTPLELYTRDRVEVSGLEIDRPYDLRADDQRLLASGLPLLLDGLPRNPPRRVLCFRCGYGPLPLVSRKRWPEARVVGIDRDLLATTFTRENAARLGLAGDRLEIREGAHFPDALQAGERFDLVLGELSAASSARVAASEIEALGKVLERGGQALILVLDKLERKWVVPAAKRNNLSFSRIIARDGYALLRSN